MELITDIIDFVMHLEKHLSDILQYCGLWTYLILFMIIFCETGLVITPFLPGDSLLFVVGALSASGELNLIVNMIVLILAAIIGDTVNYHIGKLIGLKVFHKEKVRFFKKEYLIRTHEFYEKHGGKTIIIARFIPIIRTFAPFVAGMGMMTYWRFISYNIIGAVIWVSAFIIGGYFFGNIPIVKDNFFLVVLVIIFISVLPGIVAFIKSKWRKEEGS